MEKSSPKEYLIGATPLDFQTWVESPVELVDNSEVNRWGEIFYLVRGQAEQENAYVWVRVNDKTGPKIVEGKLVGKLVKIDFAKGLSERLAKKDLSLEGDWATDRMVIEGWRPNLVRGILRIIVGTLVVGIFGLIALSLLVWDGSGGGGGVSYPSYSSGATQGISRSEMRR